MKNSPPSIEDWRNLYQQAIKFKEVSCWDWMWDSDIFGVKNPTTGEIGYCCVMGRGKEHFGLAVYLGSEGLEGYLKIASGGISPEDPDVIFIQRCLMASFENREMLVKPDFEIINRLGFKFRGKNSWPWFRKYEPGYPPWFLTSKTDVEFLTLALEQTIDVALRFKKDCSLLAVSKQGEYLVRVKEGEQWMDRKLKPPPKKSRKVVIGHFDQERLEKIKGKITQRGSILEIDFFISRSWWEILREPISLVFLVVDSYSGFIFDAGMTASLEELCLKFPSQFLDLIEKVGFFAQRDMDKKRGDF